MKSHQLDRLYNPELLAADYVLFPLNMEYWAQPGVLTVNILNCIHLQCFRVSIPQ